MPISTPRSPAMTPRARQYDAQFQGGRPSIYTMTEAIRARADAGADPVAATKTTIALRPACS